MNETWKDRLSGGNLNLDERREKMFLGLSKSEWGYIIAMFVVLLVLWELTLRTFV